MPKTSELVPSDTMERSKPVPPTWVLVLIGGILGDNRILPSRRGDHIGGHLQILRFVTRSAQRVDENSGADAKIDKQSHMTGGLLLAIRSRL